MGEIHFRVVYARVIKQTYYPDNLCTHLDAHEANDIKEYTHKLGGVPSF